MVKAVFLDIDGTLMDTNYLHIEAWAQAFEEVGARPPRSRIHHEVGKGSGKLIPEFVEDDQKAERVSVPALTVSEIARAADLSVRGLQESFQRTLDRTPMQYLREVRLRRAHDDRVRSPWTRSDGVLQARHDPGDGRHGPGTSLHRWRRPRRGRRPPAERGRGRRSRDCRERWRRGLPRDTHRA